jgi:predicted SnoaL-like aldol condensation-catalyzing enzyme
MGLRDRTVEWIGTSGVAIVQRHSSLRSHRVVTPPAPSAPTGLRGRGGSSTLEGMVSRRSLALLGLAAIALLALLPPPALVLGPGAPAVAPETFERLEQRLMTALQNHDRAAMEALLADDYELTSTEVSGGRLGKVGYVQRAMGAELPPIDAFRFRSMTTTQLSDDLVMVRLDVEWHSTPPGPPPERRYLVTDVWRLRNGAWQLLSRHATQAR